MCNKTHQSSPHSPTPRATASTYRTARPKPITPPCYPRQNTGVNVRVTCLRGVLTSDSSRATRKQHQHPLHPPQQHTSMASNTRASFEESKVNLWLNSASGSTSIPSASLPEPESEPKGSPSTPHAPSPYCRSRKRKRERDGGDYILSLSPGRPRNPLREANINLPPAKDSMPESSRPKGGPKPPPRASQRLSPRKNAPPPPPPPPPQITDNETDEADEADGAEYARALQEIPSLPRRGTKSYTSTQSRSSSPVKTIHDLTMADPPITFFEANSKTIQPTEPVSQLYNKVLDVSDGFNLLPQSLHVRSPYSVPLENGC